MLIIHANIAILLFILLQVAKLYAKPLKSKEKRKEDHDRVTESNLNSGVLIP